MNFQRKRTKKEADSKHTKNHLRITSVPVKRRKRILQRLACSFDVTLVHVQQDTRREHLLCRLHNGYNLVRICLQSYNRFCIPLSCGHTGPARSPECPSVLCTFIVTPHMIGNPQNPQSIEFVQALKRQTTLSVTATLHANPARNKSLKTRCRR